VGELNFYTSPWNPSLLIEQDRPGRAEAAGAVGTAGASLAAHDPQRLFQVYRRTFGTQSSLDGRHAINVFGVGLAPSASEPPPDVVQLDGISN
jgi:hypothetical protein